MPIKPFATNNNLLTYGLSSEPDPIGISPGVAMLNITVSNTTTQPIWCNRIQIQYPVGTDARDLTNDPGTIHVIVAPDTWRMIAKTEGLITIAPVNDQHAKITSEGLLFQLSAIAVNDKIGTFILGIDEHSHTGDGNYQKHRNEYLISKFPYGWFMTDLAPRAALVEHGGPAVLDWQASADGVFEIFYGSHGPVDVSSGPPFTSEPIEVDTVFILKGSFQVGGETVSHYLTTAVAVAHPALDASSLSVGGWSALKGGAEITGDARITGAASVGSLSSTGAATVGALTADSVRSNGPLHAEGPATVKSSLTVDAQSTLAGLLVRGLLQANGRTSLFGQARKVDPGTYKAVTDGLVIGAVFKGGDNPTRLSVAWVSGRTAGYEVRATGGNFVPWIEKVILDFNCAWASNPNSFLMPVRAGDDWAVGSQQADGNHVNPTVGLWWLPIGGETAGATFEPVPPERRVEISPLPVTVIEQGTAVSRLLDLLEEITGTTLTDEQRARVLGPPPSAGETGPDSPPGPA